MRPTSKTVVSTWVASVVGLFHQAFTHKEPSGFSMGEICQDNLTKYRKIFWGNTKSTLKITHVDFSLSFMRIIKVPGGICRQTEKLYV